MTEPETYLGQYWVHPTENYPGYWIDYARGTGPQSRQWAEKADEVYGEYRRVVHWIDRNVIFGPFPNDPEQTNVD